MWDRVVSTMPRGVFIDADSMTLKQYCEVCVLREEALQHYRQHGGRLPDGRVSGRFRIWSELDKRVSKIGAKLGLNPTDRVKLNLPTGAKKKSKWAGLLPYDDV